MIADKQFIIGKIEKLGTAIFSNYSMSICKFPTCIIKIASIDKNGLIWFTVKRPFTDMQGLDTSFPARLQLYNKHYDYHITADGLAFIIADIRVAAEKDTKTAEHEILIRFNMVHAEYFYDPRHEPTDFVHRLSDQITSLLGNEKECHSLQYHLQSKGAGYYGRYAGMI